MEASQIRERVEQLIRAENLIEPGGDVLCLVSGGADSTCLWHALRALDYRVSALHVNHRQRGEESQQDASFCRDALGAEVVEAGEPGMSEAELRELRYSFGAGRLRATGHTASDQVETIIYRLVSSGSTRGIKLRREDGVVRPLLGLWRDETRAYCLAEGLGYREDSSNPGTVRGVIRSEVLPALRRLHPAAEENILACARERPRLPRAGRSAARAARLARWLEVGRSEPGAKGRARVRPALHRAGALAARGQGALRPLDPRVRAGGITGTLLQARRSPRRTKKEDSRRVRRRQDSPFAEELLAARGQGRGDRRSARDRGGAGL